MTAESQLGFGGAEFHRTWGDLGVGTGELLWGRTRGS
jgi:hypothetical protein